MYSNIRFDYVFNHTYPSKNSLLWVSQITNHKGMGVFALVVPLLGLWMDRQWTIRTNGVWFGWVSVFFRAELLQKHSCDRCVVVVVCASTLAVSKSVDSPTLSRPYPFVQHPAGGEYERNVRYHVYHGRPVDPSAGYVVVSNARTE